MKVVTQGAPTLQEGPSPDQMLNPVYEVVGEASWNSWRKTAMLIKHMTWRSLAVRYRGSSLGFFWSLLNPVLSMIVYTVVFRYIFQVNAPGVPFQAYLVTGVLAWNFVSSAAIQASVALLTGSSLASKSAFPRIALPVSTVLASAVNYVVALPLLVAFILMSGVAPTTNLLLLPFAILLLLIIAVGLGVLLSALMPFFIDLQHLVEVLFTMWFFLTPVVYHISMVPDSWRPWYTLNPMVGIIQFIHTVFLGEELYATSLAIATVSSIGIASVGLWVFRRLSVHCTEA